MIKILVVTDDVVMERMLQVTMTINGLQVEVVSSFSMALVKISQESFNGILFDDGLDDGDNYDFNKFLGKIRTPIIVLCRYPKTRRVENFDYVTDPQDFLELKECMNRKLFRMHTLKETFIKYGEMEIDVRKQLVKVGNKAITLSRTEFAILVSLAKSTGKFVAWEHLKIDLEAQGIFFNSSIAHFMNNLKLRVRETELFKIMQDTQQGYRLSLLKDAK